MSAIDLKELFQSEPVRKMFIEYGARLRKRIEADRAANPERWARIERHERGEFTDEEVAAAKKRIWDDDYPHTPFGDHLYRLDIRAAASRGAK